MCDTHVLHIAFIFLYLILPVEPSSSLLSVDVQGNDACTYSTLDSPSHLPRVYDMT